MSADAAIDRAALAALADVLIPAAEGMPSAGEAGAPVRCSTRCFASGAISRSRSRR